MPMVTGPDSNLEAVSVTPQQIRRALARADRGAALDEAEAAALLAASGDQLDALCAIAARVQARVAVSPLIRSSLNA